MLPNVWNLLEIDTQLKKFKIDKCPKKRDFNKEALTTRLFRFTKKLINKGFFTDVAVLRRGGVVCRLST